MSPSESQLRAALHEGEGEGLDAGLLIVHANRLRRDRRRRINQIAGATLVVGVVGVGFTLLTGSGGENAGNSSSGGGGAAAQRTSAADGGAGGGGGQGPRHAAPPAAKTAVPSPGGSGAYSLVGCPSVPTHIALPTGVTPDEASGPLLPQDATEIRACGYPEGTRSRSVVLRSTDASALAAAINSAPSTPSRVVRSCTKDQLTGTVELQAVDGAGRHGKPVVITVACPNAVATNGTATRYLAVAPTVLRNLLR